MSQRAPGFGVTQLEVRVACQRKKVSMTCLPSVPVTTNHKGILHGERVKAERAAAETIPSRVVLLVLRGVAEHSGGGCVFVFVNLVM